MTEEGTPLRGRWIAMAALLVAGFMNLIDVTIVNVAIPSLQDALQASDSQIEWVVAAYILSFALFLLPAGRLGDVVGQRRMFVIGVTVFTIASALCGLAPGIGSLVAARVLQGLGGAMMTPQTLALVPALFPPRERGAAFALFGLSAGLASVAGPLLGGVLIGADIMGLDWRPIFLVNIPVGAVAVLGALRFVPKVPGDAALRLDLAGMALAGTGLMLLLFPLIEGRQLGWPVWVFAMMVAAIPTGAGFVAWQRRQARRGAPQLIPASLLANADYVTGSVLATLLFAGIPGFFLVFAIFLQLGYGLTPLESGITTLPFSLGVLGASVLSGRLGTRWPRERITAGAVLLVIGMTALRLMLPEAGGALSRAAFIVPLALSGLGLGTAVSPLFQTVLANVADRDTGAGSGALQSFQQVGGALGVAVMGQLFFGMLRGGGGYPDALTAALWFNAAAFVAVALLVWRLPEPRLVPGQGPGGKPEPTPAE
ncbi:EmrB/QacA subfamily drug resistance transporter [Limimaricola soesokkakensis]|uniref:EmrB/QacA subfamily drug resistance transporter n=1 Tax=Limimaricola soesokkakensis TaxID=1343159 RepID=A0A1X6YUX0_9RHOB|nr:MFS transporter [Limimaricola soesokkakensis]PSK87571.1 EmrB/QacA subfamily drug resistance transporter [Limimaricola soesokkakensis]SLN31348.1 Multidrug resistance protein stp [Limimaricola soesokkakensis]